MFTSQADKKRVHTCGGVMKKIRQGREIGIKRLKKRSLIFQRWKCLVPSFKTAPSKQSPHLLSKELCDTHVKGVRGSPQHLENDHGFLWTRKDPLKKGQTEAPVIVSTSADAVCTILGSLHTRILTSSAHGANEMGDMLFTIKQMRQWKHRASKVPAQHGTRAKCWCWDLTQSPYYYYLPSKVPWWPMVLFCPHLSLSFKICHSVFYWVLTTPPITKTRTVDSYHVCSIFFFPNNKNWTAMKTLKYLKPLPRQNEKLFSHTLDIHYEQTQSGSILVWDYTDQL